MFHKFRLSFCVFTVLSICVLFSSAALAQKLPPRPRNSYVYDENRLMTAQEIRQFNILAEELYRKTGVGMACALMNNIGRNDYRSFAVRTAEKWGIGGKTNEGILIFVDLKQRRRSVEIGYGAEGYLPDVLVERLQQKTLVPAFRQQKYGQGIITLAWELAQITAKEKNVNLELNQEQFTQKEQEAPPRMILFILFILFLLIMSKSSGGRGNGCLWFLIGNAIGSSGRNRHHGGFGGGFGGSHGGFGGGFGGGHFGGGGSGGSW